MSLEKLTILGFKENPKSTTKRSGNDGGTFVCQINPEKITLTKTITYEEAKPNTAGQPQNFKSIGPQTLKFDIILDNTGWVDANLQTSNIMLEVAKLEGVLYEYDGDKHESHYLIIHIGDFGFSGRLKDMTVEYALFSNAGHPMRAKCILSFTDALEPTHAELEARKSSPDMTHLKTIRYGDSVRHYCDEIYNDPEFYIQVSKINDILNFRNIPMGKMLEFPPLQK